MENNNFFVQKDKYRSRAEKFLMLGGTAVAATMGALVFAPVLGALAVPAIITSVALAASSMAGFGANKVAESITDEYEPLSKRAKVGGMIASLRAKAFGGPSEENKLKI